MKEAWIKYSKVKARVMLGWNKLLGLLRTLTQLQLNFKCMQVDNAEQLVKSAAEHGVNLRLLDSGAVTISLDETTTLHDVDHLLTVLNSGKAAGFSAESLADTVR
jgi:glycine cleavage system pyridoxal-binding protein P